MTDSRMLAMHEDLEAVRSFDEDLPTFDHKLFGSKNNAGYSAELNAALRGVHDAICDLNYELWSTKYALIKETKEGME